MTMTTSGSASFYGSIPVFHGFGSLMIQPVHGDAASPAIRVLVRATKGGHAPTRLLAGVMLNDEGGGPSPDVQAILAGKGQLPLAIP